MTRALAAPLLGVALWLAAPRTSGRALYVDLRTGNDRNAGTSEAKAFRTIGAALGAVAPGDTVRIKAGLYRERLVMTRSGTAESPILITAHGDGEVVLDGSRPLPPWSRVRDGIYRTFPGFKVVAVVADDRALVPEGALDRLGPGRYLFVENTGELDVWLPDGGSPEASDLGVIEDDAYKDALLLNAASHVTLSGLTVRFASGHGISVLGDDVRVERCRLAFNGKNGVSAFGYGGVKSVGLQVVDNEIHDNMMRNWPRGRFKWGGWGAGAGSNGTPRARFERNKVYRNHGEGITAYGGAGGTVYRANVAYDNWSVNLYVANQPGAIVESNFVYCREPSLEDLANNGDPTPWDNRSARRLRPEGIMTGDEKYEAGAAATLRDVTIANNVIVNCRRGITHYGEVRGSGWRAVKLLHNTIVVPARRQAWESPLSGIRIPFNGGNNAESLVRNNLVVGAGGGNFLVEAEGAGAGELARGLTIDHNLFFSDAPAPFRWDGTDHAFWPWQSLLGDAGRGGNLFADPKLVGGALEDAGARRVSAGSAAIDGGLDCGIREDHAGAPRPIGKQVDIGAFEFGAVSPPKP